MSTGQVSTSPVTVGADGYVLTGVPDRDHVARHRTNSVVEARFRAELAVWASANTGRLRTREAIRWEVSEEYVVLLRALGGWAQVPASELFPFDPDEFIALWLE